MVEMNEAIEIVQEVLENNKIDFPKKYIEDLASAYIRREPCLTSRKENLEQELKDSYTPHTRKVLTLLNSSSTLWEEEKVL